MGIRQPTNLEERLQQAAEAVLKRDGSVGPLELFCQIQILHPLHFERWTKGAAAYPTLEPHIQCGEAKLAAIRQLFLQWVAEKGLQAVTANYSRAGVRGDEPLQITKQGDPEQEQFFRTHFAPAGLSPTRSKRLQEKLNKTPEITVFLLTGKPSPCSLCGETLETGDMIRLEREEPVCLACADLDHLEFLPSGDATLTRRARKLSPLAAVVVQFNRRRKRYERQGILVTEVAIAAAEASCAEDADERAAERVKARARREEEDHELVEAMTALIRERFPNCPAAEAREIAAHTAHRGSGRVGRSAAGRSLHPTAIDLAVIAWIRHQHTRYDELLMSGVERDEAREMIRDDVASWQAKWSERHGASRR